MIALKRPRNQFTDYNNFASIDKESIILDVDAWKDKPIFLDIDTLKSMSSGTCIISPCHDNPIAVCKEGNTIKIFKICIEEMTHSSSDTENLLVVEG